MTTYLTSLSIMSFERRGKIENLQGKTNVSCKYSNAVNVSTKNFPWLRGHRFWHLLSGFKTQ